MVCGFAEILKHSIIKDKIFLIGWKKILKQFCLKNRELTYAIKKSCEIKMYFVSRDVNEKGLRMILNFDIHLHMQLKSKIITQKKLLMEKQYLQV